MNPVYNFSAYEHSVMLGDHIRLDAYHKAIMAQVKPGMVVAEIGTGTGILSAYAAAQTKGPVFAIEYKEAYAFLTTTMMKAAGIEHVQVLQGKSFDVLLDPAPTVLITETIGAIGPEEHIVEICHDFKKRHPSIERIIPSRLRMYAEAIRSVRIHQSEQTFLDYFSQASYGAFNYDAIRPDLLTNRSTHLLYDSLSDAETVAPRILLADYILGETATPAFTIDLEVGKLELDGYHLYFEAVLDDDLVLSTHFSKPETHWGNAYVRRPDGGKVLNLAYEESVGWIVPTWKH
jgi:predicted RNA methylase